MKRWSLLSLLLVGFKMFHMLWGSPYRCLFPSLSVLIGNLVLSKSTFIPCHRANEPSGSSLRLELWMLSALISGRTSPVLTGGFHGFLKFPGANSRTVPQIMPHLLPSNHVTTSRCKPVVQKRQAVICSTTDPWRFIGNTERHNLGIWQLLYSCRF